MTLTYSAEAHGWSDPHIQLSWVNPQEHLCDMYLGHVRDEVFHVRVICWGSLNELGRHDWDLDLQKDRLTVVLLEAKHWGDHL